MLITLSLRLFVLTSDQGRQFAEMLLKTAREIMLQWIFRSIIAPAVRGKNGEDEDEESVFEDPCDSINHLNLNGS